MPAVTVREALIARDRIKHLVRETRMELSPSLSDFMKVPVYLKLECHQATGSFKLRGATNAIAGLTSQQRALGVVTASTGNHGRALSYAAAAMRRSRYRVPFKACPIQQGGCDSCAGRRRAGGW